MLSNEEEELLAEHRKIEERLRTLRVQRELDELINQQWDEAIAIDTQFNIIRDEKAKLDKVKDITIKVNKLDRALQHVVIDFPYRVDISDLVSSRRQAVSMSGHSISLQDWPDLRDELSKLPKVTIWYRAGVEEELTQALVKPDWLVEKEDKYFRVTTGVGISGFDLAYKTSMNPQRDRYDATIWRVPLAEAVELYNFLQDRANVTITDAAKELMLKVVERKLAIDSVATLKDYDFGEYIFHPDAVDETGAQFTPKGFQNVGIHFAEMADGNCIISDVPGLGKTSQALGYSLRLAKKIRETENREARILVICQGSLKPNWSRHIRNLTGTAPYTCAGIEPDSIDMATLLVNKPQYVIMNFDIMARGKDVTNITVAENGWKREETRTRYFWIELINMYKPDLVIIDEGHYLKNDESKRSIASRLIKCPRFMTLTGTPILNRPGEFWPILTLSAPETFPNKQAFLNSYTYDGVNPKNTKQLHELLKPIMIRRTRADVMDEVPLCNRITMDRELSERAMKLYRKVLSGIYEQVAAYSATGMTGEKDVTNMLVQIQRLKQVCAIDSVDDTVERALEFVDEMEGSGEPSKVILFSQFKATAYAMYQRLADTDSALCFIRRGPKEFETLGNYERDNMVRKFQTDPKTKFIIVTEKTAKEGHDMTEAGAVFFNDLFWTPAAHEQGEGRAFGRMNNPHGINSYYNQCTGTITEWIRELLYSKMAIIEEVVDGVEDSRRKDKSIVMELIDRLQTELFKNRGK